MKRSMSWMSLLRRTRRPIRHGYRHAGWLSKRLIGILMRRFKVICRVLGENATGFEPLLYTKEVDGETEYRVFSRPQVKHSVATGRILDYLQLALPGPPCRHLLSGVLPLHPRLPVSPPRTDVLLRTLKPLLWSRRHRFIGPIVVSLRRGRV